MTTAILIQIILALITSGGLAALIWKQVFGKKRENAEVNTLIIGGAKITLEMSDVINKAIDTKTLERTQELRELIAANELKHYKEVSAQGQVYATSMAKSEESYEIKIKGLYQKINSLEGSFNQQMKKLERDLVKEMEGRAKCLADLSALQKEANEFLKGPQGDPGVQGIQGERGLKGEPGENHRGN